MSPARRQPWSTPRPQPRSSDLGLRSFVFAVLMVATGTAVFLVWPRPPSVDAAAQAVTVDMAGFRPGSLTAKAGQSVRVQLVNPDSPYHTDGGGWHEMAIPQLGIDAKVAPRSTAILEIPASTLPGEYLFYCDICCGGKENPSMQGVLKVTT